MERAAAAANPGSPELDIARLLISPLPILFFVIFIYQQLRLYSALCTYFLQGKNRSSPVRPLYTRNKRSVEKNKTRHENEKIHKRPYVIYREWLGRG